MPDALRPEALALAREITAARASLRRMIVASFGPLVDLRAGNPLDLFLIWFDAEAHIPIALALDKIMAEREKFRVMIERAVIAPEDHDGGTSFPVAYGKYDADTEQFIPPAELPNIPALERQLTAERAEHHAAIAQAVAIDNALAAERAARQAAEEENAALRRQYNEQLDRVARADAETTRIRYELEALVGAKDHTLEKLLALIVEGPIRPGSIAEQTACGAIRAALALTPADLRARQEAEAKVIGAVLRMVGQNTMDFTQGSRLLEAVHETGRDLAALRAGETTT